MAGDLYQLLLMVNGRGVLTFFAETRDEAEQHGKRMVETERKKNVDMTMFILHSPDVVDELRQAFLGKWFNIPNNAL